MKAIEFVGELTTRKKEEQKGEMKKKIFYQKSAPLHYFIF